jgi:hypothetical protein
MKYLFTFFALLLFVGAMAQQAADKIPAVRGMRSEGKIYVVVAVLLTVLAGLFLYVVNLNRKVNKLEK